jgi:hypothetical protein
MTWKETIKKGDDLSEEMFQNYLERKKTENPPKGRWPMGTQSEQKKEFGEVMFDEFGRDADERGELSLTPEEFKHKEILKYVNDIDRYFSRLKGIVDVPHDKVAAAGFDIERAKKVFLHIKEISEDAIEVIKE